MYTFLLLFRIICMIYYPSYLPMGHKHKRPTVSRARPNNFGQYNMYKFTKRQNICKKIIEPNIQHTLSRKVSMALRTSWLWLRFIRIIIVHALIRVAVKCRMEIGRNPIRNSPKCRAHYNIDTVYLETGLSMIKITRYFYILMCPE